MTSLCLYQYQAAFGLASSDSQCLEAQCYLRLCDVPFSVNTDGNERVSPTNSLPMLQLDSHAVSGLTWRQDIAVHVRDLDQWLSGEQRAVCMAVHALCADRLRAAVDYVWWCDDQTFDVFTKRVVSARLPFPVSFFVRSRRRAREQERVAALGLHSMDAAMRVIDETLAALSARLAARQWLFGEQPSSADAAMFAQLAIMHRAPLPKATLRGAVERHSNLLAFVERVLSDTFHSDAPLEPPMKPLPVRTYFRSWSERVAQPVFKVQSRADYERRRQDFLFITAAIFVVGGFFLSTKLAASNSRSAQ